MTRFTNLTIFAVLAMAVVNNNFKNKGESTMNRFTNFTIFAVLAMAAVLSAFCTPAFADQITIDLPVVNVAVSKDADGYAKFSFSDERIQFIGKTGDPAIPYLVVKSLLPPGTDLSTIQVEIKKKIFHPMQSGKHGKSDQHLYRQHGTAQK